jgi:hypothetical protein
MFSDLIDECVENYMDDFFVCGDTFNGALDNLEKVLIRCRESYLALSNEKCKIFSKEGIVLSHHISSAGIKVDLAKIKVIMDLPTPWSQKEVRSFLGHVGYYRIFIVDFKKIATPMYRLLDKDIDFVWDSQCQDAFDNLK